MSILFRNSIFVFLFVISGCAGITPKNQTNNFSTPSVVVPNLDGIEKKFKSVQETNQASMNGLVNLNGKVSGIEEANVSMKNDLAAIRGDVSAFKTSLNVQGDVAAIKADGANLKAELTAKLVDVASSTVNLQGEMAAMKLVYSSVLTQTASQNSGRDSNVNYLPPYVWYGVVGIMCLVIVTLGSLAWGWKNSKEIMKLKAVTNPTVYKTLSIAANNKET